MIKGLRKVAGVPLEIGEDPIPIFASYERETRPKELVEIHRFLCRLRSARNRDERRLLPVVRQGWEAAADHHSKRIEKREELLLMCLGQIEEAFDHVLGLR